MRENRLIIMLTIFSKYSENITLRGICYSLYGELETQNTRKVQKDQKGADT